MFPSGFVWGSASSSYQVEGAASKDGKGPSVWDAFCRTPGAVYQGHTGDNACEHYDRYKQDVALMKQLGIPAYRFSIAWPRVLPAGIGKVNEAGLGFYDRLVDELLAASIEPWITLFHWDFPQELYLAGGWLNRESHNWFAEFSKIIVDRLSDRVRNWITINEPQVYIGLGHLDTKHAPGIKLPFDQGLLAGHHTMLAHGRAVQVIRARAKKPPLVGWAPVGRVEYPATDSQADIDAARASSMAATDRNVWSNTWFGDAAIFGRYPEDALKSFGADAPQPKPGDMELIAQKLDFYGVNIYSGSRVKASDKAGDKGKAVPVPLGPGHARNALDWAVAPEALRWGPRFLYERYKLPIVVTENGMTNLDWVHSDGACHDPQRIDYMRRYLIELSKAIADGADVRGYFAWSIMDNFEWAEGYKDRFGLVHVDFQTQERTPKDSAHWYTDVIASNGATLNDAHAGLDRSVYVYEGVA